MRGMGTAVVVALLCACGSKSPQLWQVGKEKDWTQAAAGFQASCGIRDNGHVWCWGRSDYGQIPGQSGDVKQPLPVAVDKTFSAIARPELGVCGQDSSGAIQCWGFSSHGDLGADGGVGPGKPVQQAQSGNDWSSVAKGRDHTCAVRQSRVYCWGGNFAHELGDAFPYETTAPLEVPKIGAVQSTDAMSAHNCALAADGKLWCWGGGAELASDGGASMPQDPFAINGDTDWASYSVGTEFAVAVKTDGSLWQWGRFGRGFSQPIARIGSDSDWASVSAGEVIACAIKKNGSLWCWGEDGEYELLLGHGDHKIDPIEVKPGSTWTQVSCGVTHVCALNTDKSLWCWGSYQNGELGSLEAEESHKSSGGHHGD